MVAGAHAAELLAAKLAVQGGMTAEAAAEAEQEVLPVPAIAAPCSLVASGCQRC
jgi:hypothetical protein